MAGKKKTLIAVGSLLVLLALGAWISELVWTESKATQAGDYLEAQLKEYFAGQPKKSVFVKVTSRSVHGKPFTLLESTPPGALLYRGDELISEHPTPVVLEGSTFHQLEFRTPWRVARVDTYEGVVALQAKPLYQLLGLLGVLGLLAVGGGLSLKEPPPEEPVAPEDLFGHYQRLELLGEGGMGSVFAARSTKTGDGRAYALKVLQPQFSEDDIFRARFEREGAFCQKLDHPGIVKVHEQGQRGDELWLVMDQVEGVELADWLSAQQPNRATIIELFIKLCDALVYAHGLEIIHRDLKPDNIMVTTQGDPVIMDFGLARGEYYPTITQADTTLGTPEYMSPEQVRGESRDVRGDLYSLGCILYQCFSGRPPFQGNAIEVIMAQLSAPPPALEASGELDADMIALIERLLDKDPEKRHSCAADLKDDLASMSR